MNVDSCSSSIMIRPSRRVGAKIADRAPTTTWISASGNRPPVTVSFGVTQVAMKHGNSIKPTPKASDRLRSQANFRNKDNGLTASRDDPLDGAKVDLCLSAAGHAMKQERDESVTAKTGVKLFEDLGLFRSQGDGSLAVTVLDVEDRSRGPATGALLILRLTVWINPHFRRRRLAQSYILPSGKHQGRSGFPSPCRGVPGFRPAERAA